MFLVGTTGTGGQTGEKNVLMDMLDLMCPEGNRVRTGKRNLEFSERSSRPIKFWNQLFQ